MWATRQAPLSAFDQLDIACHSAGIGGEMNRVGDYLLKGWKKVMNSNLNSIFYFLKYDLAVRKEGASIVNIASILGQVGMPHSAACESAKLQW
jgi:NAD(P)-dependent dehydrogenase (short-subunit alcohol dehydrogenase family)